MNPDLSTLLDQIFASDTTHRGAAFTRRAWLEEHRGSGNYRTSEHHEALECYGDAWLDVVVLRELLRRFPEANEAELTRTREALVDTQHLAQVARSHGLMSEVRAGAGERKQDQHLQDSALESHVEAVVGAAATVGGDQAAASLVHHLFRDAWPDELTRFRISDAKGELGRLEAEVHRTPGREPSYSTERVEGTPDHSPQYVSTVTPHDGTPYCGAPASTKKQAEQNAAQEALAQR